jgi:NTE family protein
MSKSKKRIMLELLTGGVGRLREFAYGDLEHVPRKPRVGLALAGGFARGIAHIGVLRVFEEERIPIHCIAGTSVGALIAAAYASGTSLNEMERQGRVTKFTDFGRWTLSRLGLASNQKLEEFMARFNVVKTFEELKIPMCVAATDLSGGKTVYFTHGELNIAVRASCAYPGLFLPIQLNGQMLVDGFVTEPVPVEGARNLGADIVIAVYLSTSASQSKPKSFFDVIGRAFAIVQRAGESVWREAADVVIEPDVKDMLWDSFDKTPELVAAGKAAARQALPAIRHAIAEFERVVNLPPAE